MAKAACSICGHSTGDLDASGPGPHRFHLACINGAHNFYALLQAVGGDTKIVKMAVWPNAEKAGISHPFPPFRPVRPTSPPSAASIERTNPRPGQTKTADPCPECGADLTDFEPVLVDAGLPTERQTGIFRRHCTECAYCEGQDCRPDPDLEYDASLDQQRRTEAATRAALGGTFRDPSLERDRQPIGRHTDVSA